MKRGRAETIVEEVRAAVSKWPDYAEQAQVMSDWRKLGSQVTALKGIPICFQITAFVLSPWPSIWPMQHWDSGL